mmetsp:Transcript_5652/g.4802  ORF Transcript_5652/g.4802 Transcript_5652/m.4802 type:complete len:111 (+) Transcript_5652:226-558(+)
MGCGGSKNKKDVQKPDNTKKEEPKKESPQKPTGPTPEEIETERIQKEHEAAVKKVEEVIAQARDMLKCVEEDPKQFEQLINLKFDIERPTEFLNQAFELLFTGILVDTRG